MFCCLANGDLSILGVNNDFHAMPMKGSQGILQSNTELADQMGMILLFLVFVLGQVLVLNASAVIPDVPSSGLIPINLNVIRAGQNLLVQSVCDDLPDRMGYRPVL